MFCAFLNTETALILFKLNSGLPEDYSYCKVYTYYLPPLHVYASLNNTLNTNPISCTAVNQSRHVYLSTHSKSN